jgi:D-lyxose ketol-isomerase
MQAIKDTMLGWDVTDFCSNHFESLGAVLFTLRNGSIVHSSIGTPYAEKYIMLQPGQALPMHMHRTKTEDIINRSGGEFIIKLFGAGDDQKIDYHKDAVVYCDGHKKTLKAGEELAVTKGNSITLRPFVYHSFWAANPGDDIVIGEVSSINDDNTDNVFVDQIGRFSKTEEDESKRFLLCNEYN